MKALGPGGIPKRAIDILFLFVPRRPLRQSHVYRTMPLLTVTDTLLLTYISMENCAISAMVWFQYNLTGEWEVGRAVLVFQSLF